MIGLDESDARGFIRNLVKKCYKAPTCSGHIKVRFLVLPVISVFTDRHRLPNSTMSCDVAAHPAQQAYFDDEITALAVQLEEINCREENSKGKSRADEIPDIDVAVSTYQLEVQAHIQFMHDLKLAHSIASAVDTDGQAIAEATQGESQAQQDRQLALQVNERGDEEPEAPPPYSQVDLSSAVLEERLNWAPNLYDAETDDEDENAAGPSTAYQRHQGKALKALSRMDAFCSVCFERFRQCEVRRLQCEHTYCHDCLNNLFMRATKDETLFPPRCCRQPVPLDYVIEHMTEDELETFRGAQVEFTTQDKTYCSNTSCGRFIYPQRIRAGRAECGYCGSLTCSNCKNAFHLDDDCPTDPAVQQTLDLVRTEGWQRCYSCRRFVQLHTGCYHIT